MAEPKTPSAVSDRTTCLTPETALELGKKTGTIYKKVGLAIDADSSTAPVSYAFASGLNAAGADVFYAGVCPAPAACLALGKTCGCVATLGCPSSPGSVELNLYHSDGSEFNSVDLHMFETEPELPDWSHVGCFKKIDDVGETYIGYISNSGLKATGYIVVDCGCGSASSVAPEALSRLGADVSSMDSDRRRRKPRNPAAAKSDLLTLSNFVDSSTGSVGVAYNADGTRLSVMDEDGKYVPPEGLLSILMMYLEPRTAVIPFNSPAVVEDAFRKPLGLRINGHGSDPDRTLLRAVTDEDIIATCVRSDADFGALSDGRFIFPEINLCPDAVYTSAVVAEISGQRSLRNILKELPTYYTKQINVPFSSTPRIFDSKISNNYAHYRVMSVDKSDQAWKLVMEHGICTIVLKESELTIYSESVDQMYLATMTEQILELVRACM